MAAVAACHPKEGRVPSAVAARVAEQMHRGGGPRLVVMPHDYDMLVVWATMHCAVARGGVGLGSPCSIRHPDCTPSGGALGVALCGACKVVAISSRFGHLVDARDE